MGLASIVLGLFSIILIYVLPVTRFLGFADSPELWLTFAIQTKKAPILAITGLVFGVIDLIKKRTKWERKVYSIAGLSINLVAISLFIAAIARIIYLGK